MEKFLSQSALFQSGDGFATLRATSLKLVSSRLLNMLKPDRVVGVGMIKDLPGPVWRALG